MASCAILDVTPAPTYPVELSSPLRWDRPLPETPGTNSVRMRSTTRLNFIDLFAGCGGFSLGLFEAGWRGLFAVERDEMAFRSLATNFMRVNTRHRFRWPAGIPRTPLDIVELLQNKRGVLESLSQRGIDLVCGGPPCQGFSFSGRRRRNDPRNRLIDAYAEFIRLIGPRFLLVENVPGILVPHGAMARRAKNPSGIGRPAVSYAQRLQDFVGASDGPGGGYEFDKCLVDASDFGVPQHRKRYFGVGIRRDLLGSSGALELDASAILYSIRKQHLRALGLDSRRVSAREAIGDLSKHRNNLQPCEDNDSPHHFEELAYTPPKRPNRFVQLMRSEMNGEAPNSTRLARHTPAVQQRFALILHTYRRGVRLDDRARADLEIRKHRIVPLDPRRPAHTITTLPDDILHYKEPRILSVRECARIQSFPDWFAFQGKFTTGGDRRALECPRYTQVGNAVPPILARAWGVAIAAVDARLKNST